MAQASTKRSYHSPLREAQTESTRERILQALAEQVAEEGIADFAVAGVAERAGVSERTVYRHFPSRGDLIAAVDEYWQRAPRPPAPGSLGELPDFAGPLFEFFERNEAWVQTANSSRLGKQVHHVDRERRWQFFQSQAGDWAEGVPEELWRRCSVASRVLMSSPAWLLMRDDLGLSHEQATDAVQWAVGVLIEQVERARTEETRGDREETS